MKILALSDEIVPYIHSTAILDRYADVELIVGCGDLPANYLEYVVSQLNVPLVFVPGNHDPDAYRVPGGINIDGRVIKVAGVLVAGLGGSRRYKRDGRHQYSSMEMDFRATQLLAHAFGNRMRYRQGLDLLITHAPPKGIHDQADLTHTGFEAFHNILRVAQPRLMLHGHVHVPRNIVTMETERYGCRIVNVFPARVVEYERPGK